MKKLFFIAFAFIPVLAFTQGRKYSIQGILGTYNAPAKVYLEINIKGKKIIDSATLQNGKFRFNGTIANTPTHAYLIFNEKGTGVRTQDYQDLYLENGTITVTGNSNITTATIGGTKINEDKPRYNAIKKKIQEINGAINAKYSGTSYEQTKTEAFKKEIKILEKNITVQSNAINKKYIQENPDSYFSIDALKYLAYSEEYDQIAPLYNSLSEAVKQSDEGKEFATRLPQLKGVSLNSYAPEFTEADTNGKAVSLSSFKGKYVLVDFWASWCGPCRGENPNLVKAYNHYKGKNFTIVGISLDDKATQKDWIKAIHKDGLEWTQLSELRGFKDKAAVLYDIHAIPQNFLIAPDGKIIAKNLRGGDLENKLAELFDDKKSK